MKQGVELAYLSLGLPDRMLKRKGVGGARRIATEIRARAKVLEGVSERKVAQNPLRP